MVIEQNGLPCPCGRHGCWEQYASATALKRMTAEALAAYPDSILARVITENDGHVSGQSAFIAAARVTRWDKWCATDTWTTWPAAW